MANTVTFSVTTVPKDGAQGSFRDTVLNLRTDELEDCFLSVFHVSDSYALLSGEALPGAHTATNAALRAYLIRRLAGNDTGMDFDVKIDQASQSARSYS
jgi:hypothetical protein